jgi:hypothetical protein
MLDHQKMLKEICALVETDFGFDMECKLSPKAKPYTQEEAQEMAATLAKIYGIAHCLHCKACQDKYSK